MSGRTLRIMGLGMVATAGAGLLSLAAMTQSTTAHADDIGLVLGGSGTPIPGPEYVESAALHYLEPTYGANISFYQPTAESPVYGNGLYTPEGLYPLTGVHTLPLNYPAGSDGFPADPGTSVGQGDTILTQTIESELHGDNTATVFGYSQSAGISSYVEQQLADAGIPKNDVNFLLVGDVSAPNGGLLSRFDGFTTTSGTVVSDPLNLPSLGVSFDGVTPANEYATSVYSIEYDGFTDFPKYPLNFLADLNAFLGIDTLDHYYMITTLDGGNTTAGDPITAPLVALLPKPLQELLGPDLTYLINLGYGDGSEGYSAGDADVNSPFGLAPDVSPSQVFSTLAADTQQGIQYLSSDTDPYASATASTGQSMAEVMAALHTDLADPSATITELVNALTTASSAAYSTLLPTADIINALVTSTPAYDLSLFSANIATGDLADAFGLPLAADTALVTLAAGFEVEVIQNAASEISAAFSGLF
jgi:hypothetical protein